MPERVGRLSLLGLLLVGIAVVWVCRDDLNAARLYSWIDHGGAWAPMLFMLLYALATVLFAPGSVITLAGGALFGPVWGTLYNLVGATLGATFSFLIARYLAGDWAERRAGRRLRRLKRGVDAEGWRFVALVRLVPLLPFNLLNYALGLTGIRLWHYVLTSFVFMLPGALAYTWLGYLGREAVAGGSGLIQKGLFALALLALVAFLPRLVGAMRRGNAIEVQSLRDRLALPGAPLVLDVRRAEDFNGRLGHIPRAVNIPLEQLPQRQELLEEWLERPIAVVCHTDRRSEQAAALLEREGFAHVQVVKGGMVAWHAMGGPVEWG
ncbi:MAG: sulfurtransferase [Gammaproteobacteria bacterium]|nr:MAG: sulfurtransferase [Gammaproteobacteria bacterium]